MFFLFFLNIRLKIVAKGLNCYPEAIEKAKRKILQMMGNLKEVITLIDARMIEAWLKAFLPFYR